MRLVLPSATPQVPTPVERGQVPIGWPSQAAAPAWRGPAGEFALALTEGKYSEADPHAVLTAALVGVGNVLGRKVYWSHGHTKHYCNLFTCHVGRTAGARKGTATNDALWLLDTADPTWPPVTNGLSSGEGLIALVRDAGTQWHTDKATSKKVLNDPGVSDKRRLILETEFGRTIRAMERKDNTLANLLNVVWDDVISPSIITKTLRMTATDPHISIIGHITFDELQTLLEHKHIWSGFANRWLWVAVESLRDIPSPRDFSTQKSFLAYQRQLQAVLAQARLGKRQLYTRSAKANAWWTDELYADLKHGRPDNLFGAATNRAEPLVMRLAVLYAVLDGSPRVQLAHLESAEALWRYCEGSARYIFGARDERGRSTDAQRLLEALKQAGPTGLTRNAIYRTVFQRNRKRAELDAYCAALRSGGYASMHEEPGRTRPTIRWFYRDAAPKKGKSELTP